MDSVLEFRPSTIKVGAGAAVTFCNCLTVDVQNTKPIDIVFAKPEAALAFPNPFIPTGTGNIPSLLGTSENPWGALQARSFPEPGIYEYHSELYGTKGTLIVAKAPPQ